MWCSAMKRTGAVTFNGQKLNKRFKRQIGFVMQVCDRAVLPHTCVDQMQAMHAASDLPA